MHNHLYEEGKSHQDVGNAMHPAQMEDKTSTKTAVLNADKTATTKADCKLAKVLRHGKTGQTHLRESQSQLTMHRTGCP